MPQGPAARLSDLVSHPLPPVLTGVQFSPNTLIGALAAWRGVPLAAVAALQAAKNSSDKVLDDLKAKRIAATGTPGFPAAKAAEEAAKAAALLAMGATIAAAAAGGASIHFCLSPAPLPTPHGPGVVTDGSATVTINNLPACRMGDSLLEAIGPKNKILMGCPTVLVGG